MWKRLQKFKILQVLKKNVVFHLVCSSFLHGGHLFLELLLALGSDPSATGSNALDKKHIDEVHPSSHPLQELSSQLRSCLVIGFEATGSFNQCDDGPSENKLLLYRLY